MRLKIFSVKPYTNTTPPRLTLCMYVSTDLEREREWSAKQNTERERERDLEEEEEEVGRVGLCSGAEEREREFNACNSVLLCFSVYNTAFLSINDDDGCLFRAWLVAWSCRYFFFKIDWKMCFSFFFFLWFYENTYIFYKTHVMLMSTL